MKISASRASISLPAEDALRRLGERISLARRARYLTQADLASKAGVSLSTMAAIESGAPTVQIGFYANALYAVDLLAGLDRVAMVSEDEVMVHRVGVDLMPKRVRK